MENKINIAELLKDCPKGTKLYSPITGECTLELVDNCGCDNVIRVNFYGGENEVSDTCFYKYGNYFYNGECLLFPSKGKTTWEGFHRPFKDGDIVTYDNPHRDNLQIFIFKEKKENNTLSSCYLMLDGDELDLEEGMYYITRFATEEEKQKLFDAIKANGYKWNPVTKTLEKLPKFKVGDRVREKDDKAATFTISDVDDSCYYCGEYVICNICDQDNWELVPNKFDIDTLKPFDKVLVRDGNKDKWNIDFFGYYRDDGTYQCMTFTKNQCIPYEVNKELLGTTNNPKGYGGE